MLAEKNINMYDVFILLLLIFSHLNSEVDGSILYHI